MDSSEHCEYCGALISIMDVQLGCPICGYGEENDNKYSEGYFDRDKFLHDKIEARSGNKILYTSMGIAVGVYDRREVAELKLKACDLILSETLTLRDTDDTSLDSLDNIIGFIYLGLLNTEDFIETDWYFNGYYKNDHTWKECVTDLIAIQGQDRNFWHENGFDAVGKVANLVSPHIQYYARKKSNRIAFHLAPFFYLWILLTLIKPNFKNGIRQTGNMSQKNILFLILKDLANPLIRLVNYKKNFTDYFGKNHPIVEQLR